MMLNMRWVVLLNHVVIRLHSISFFLYRAHMQKL